MDDLILLGGGGHARSVIDVIESSKKFQITGIVDRGKKVGERVLNYSVIATDEQLSSLVRPNCFFLITVGQLSSAETRIRIDQELRSAGGRLANVYSSLARVSDYASMGEGTVVMHYALINAGARVGRNVIINTRAIIEHDTVVGDFCHISTGAILNGDVTVGKNVFVGSHATLKQGISVADNVIIGAHTFVNRDIIEAGVYVGSPALKID